MGVYPYITAQIIVQLLQPLIPALEQLGKEGEQGRMRMNRITFWATVPLAYLQAYGQTLTLTRGITDGVAVPYAVRYLQQLSADIYDYHLNGGGHDVVVWLGEQIQERGIGNGISVIIFAGIVSGLPNLISQALTARSLAALSNHRHHRVPDHRPIYHHWYRACAGRAAAHTGAIPRRVRGNRVYGGQSSHIR